MLVGCSRSKRSRRRRARARASCEPDKVEMSSRHPVSTASVLAGKRVVVAGLLPPRADAEGEMGKLASRVRELGATVVGTLIQRRGVSRTGRPGGARAAHLARPLQHSTYIGPGKVRELQSLCAGSGADIVV